MRRNAVYGLVPGGWARHALDGTGDANREVLAAVVHAMRQMRDLPGPHAAGPLLSDELDAPAVAQLLRCDDALGQVYQATRRPGTRGRLPRHGPRAASPPPRRSPPSPNCSRPTGSCGSCWTIRWPARGLKRTPRQSHCGRAVPGRARPRPSRRASAGRAQPAHPRPGLRDDELRPCRDRSAERDVPRGDGPRWSGGLAASRRSKTPKTSPAPSSAATSSASISTHWPWTWRGSRWR